MPGVYGGLSTAQRRALQKDHLCRADGCSDGVHGAGYRYCVTHSPNRPGVRA